MGTEPLVTSRPVFIGGTGRSGTTVTGRLLGAHPDLWLTDPIELKFISERGGLADAVAWASRPRTEVLLESLRQAVRAARARRRDPSAAVAEARGFAPPERVVEQMRGWWFDRVNVNGTPQGLARTMTMEQVVAATDTYLATFDADPLGATRALVSTLVEPLARAAGTTRWVETTPSAGAQTDKIAMIYPDVTVVHAMRDGRDVIASVVKTQQWGPRDVMSGLVWWEIAMRRIHTAMSALPPQQRHVVQMEDLVVRDRDATLARLVSFLQLPDDPHVWEHFAAHVVAERFHQGRYRRDVPEELLSSFEAEYERVLERLDADAITRPV